MEKLDASLDTQIKNVQSQIRKEEISRAQQELLLKSDITKLAEQLRTDYELFKSQQNQLTAKITEMIKLEVDTRLTCDRENRAANEAAIKKIIEELGMFKEAVEKQNKHFAKDLKESNSENSERANFLSRYIDDQIKKLDTQVDDQIKKIKLLCARLTEQIKENFKGEEETLMQLSNELKENKEKFSNQLEELKNNCELSFNDISAWISVKKMEDTVCSETFDSTINNLSEESLKRIADLENLTQTLNKDQKDQGENCGKLNDDLEARIREEVDRKIQSMMEKLSGENIMQWNESVKLTEKIMSPEGLKDTLNAVPPNIMQMDDIKKAFVGISEAEQGRPKIVTEIGRASWRERVYVLV